MTAIETGQSAAPTKQYAEAIDEIKRLPGQMASDNALLKDSVEIMTGKNGLRAKPDHLNSPVHVRRTVESVPGGVIAAPIPAMPYRDRGTPF